MQVLFRKGVTWCTGVLVWIVLLLVSAGCGEAPEPATRPGVSLRPVVNEQAAAYLLDAQDAFQRGDVGTALALADSAEQKAGDASDVFLADVNFLRGRVHSELNHAEEAQQAYERVLALVPDYRGVLMNLGNNAFRQGQFRQALSYYDRAYAAHHDPLVQVYRGRTYAELGQVDSARAAFEAAIRQDDSLAQAHARLAYLYDQQGAFAQGLPHAERALALEQDDVDYRYLLGSMLLRSGQAEQAADHFRRVVAQQPGHSEAHYGLGQALVRLGQPQAAERYLAAADSLRAVERQLESYATRVRLYPDDPALWATYGYALYQANRDEEAMQAFQTVLYMDPEHPDVRFFVANLHLKNGELQRALDHYDALLQQDSTFAPAWVNAGIALARMGQPGAARQAWEAALRHDPNNAQVPQYLASLPTAK